MGLCISKSAKGNSSILEVDRTCTSEECIRQVSKILVDATPLSIKLSGKNIDELVVLVNQTLEGYFNTNNTQTKLNQDLLSQMPDSVIVSNLERIAKPEAVVKFLAKFYSHDIQKLESILYCFLRKQTKEERIVFDCKFKRKEPALYQKYCDEKNRQSISRGYRSAVSPSVPSLCYPIEQFQTVN